MATAKARCTAHQVLEAISSRLTPSFKEAFADPQAKNYMQSVIWPAAAGNVAWAFITTFIREVPKDEPPEVRAVQLTMLGLLAIYLSLEWLRTEKIKSILPPFYWLADLPLAGAIAVFAIMVDAKHPRAGCALASIFAIGVVGHIAGAWQKAQAEKALRLSPHSTFMVLVHGLGLVLVLSALDTSPFSWWMVMAEALVIVLWLGVWAFAFDRAPAAREGGVAA